MIKTDVLTFHYYEESQEKKYLCNDTMWRKPDHFLASLCNVFWKFPIDVFRPKIS